jgi:ATP/maltotriose-dependent transcriptional regulator MalT
LRTMIDGRGLTGMIACLPVAAMILFYHGNAVRAVEWIALAFTHPIRAAGWMQEWSLLSDLRHDLEQTLGPEAYAAAWEIGARLDLQVVAAQIPHSIQIVRPTVIEQENSTREEKLTRRELEIMCLLAAGFSNPAIAEKLVISVGTVKAHTSSIYGKLGVENRVQAVSEANRRGLV